MNVSALRILAIDDNPDNLMALKAVIADALPRAQVWVALNGSQGIELALAEEPDVILLDIVMPGMDGFEVCRALKHDDRLEHIPVIFLTAQRTERQSRIRALEAGAEAFLSKPFDELELLAQIRAMAKIKAAGDLQRQEKEQLAALVAERTRDIRKELGERSKAEQESQEANRQLLKSQTATLNLMEDLQAEIAAREKSEAAVRDSEQFAHGTIDALAAHVCVLDETGTIITVNRAWREFAVANRLADPGYAQGVNYLTVCDTATGANADEAAAFAAGIRAVMNGERNWFSLEYPCHSLAKQRWFTGMVTRFQAQGSTHIVVAHENITERKRVEEELKRQNKELLFLNTIAATIVRFTDLEDLLDTILDTVLDLTELQIGAIHLSEEDSAALTLAAYRGFTSQIIAEVETLRAGKASTLLELLAEAPWVEGTANELGFALEQGCEYVALPIKTKGRLLGVLSLFGANIPLVTDADKRLLATATDQLGIAIENMRLVERTTEIKALRELDRLRSELIANVSHELRSPLGLIKVFCTTLMAQDLAFDRATRLEFLEDIDRETDKLEQIVANLLDVSRLQNNRLRLDRHAIDLNELVLAVIETMKMNFNRHRIVYDVADERLVTSADPQRIEQVLRNLIDNALKYSPGEGMITMQCRKQAHEVIVTVSDEGIGIPAGDLEKIFERFYRVENETTQRAGGVGLGLAVSRGIIEEHGGRIWVESTLGKGSAFHFALPLLDGASAVG